MTTKAYTAILSHRRKHPEHPHYVVDVTCPGCDFTRTGGLAGWSAIVCGGCSAELHKDGTEIEIAAAFRALGVSQSKWSVYAVAFDAMKQRKVTLKDIQRIALREAGIKPGVVDGRRADWLAMGGAA
tara:strand:+ start:3980 stop:4360 length:381 start_codon:yes stop_codon:yes gene_type:complete